MKTIYTECVMAMNGCNPIFGNNRVIIRVDDEAAGPYLVIRSYNGEPLPGETEHDFFLQSEEEIDQFAAICKSMLKQAKGS